MSLHALSHMSRQPNRGLADKNIEVLGIPVAAVSRKDLTQLLVQALASDMKGWFSYVNIHTVNLAQEYSWFKQFLRDSVINYCDGEGVRFGSIILGIVIPERIVMMDWVDDVCAHSEEKGYSIYFLGSTTSIVRKAIQVLRDKYPRLSVSGYHSGYFNSMENDSIVSEINRSKTDILIVGMGMPVQERWILDNIQKLRVRIVLNGGSCFDFISGASSRS